MRAAALEGGPFTGVTSRLDMIVAERRWSGLGPEKLAAHKAMVRTTFTGPATSPKVVPFPPPLARQMRRIYADLAAFGAARVGYGHHNGPPAIASSARTLMRDIRAVQATCSRAH
jgi:hypothetical protein